MIRFLVCLSVPVFLIGCGHTNAGQTLHELQSKKPVTYQTSANPVSNALRVRPDFARNIPQLFSFLDPEQPDRNGSKQYLQDTPEVRKLLQIDSSAIVARDRPGTRGHISLTRDVEYKISAYTKQCIGFIKAVVTDPNWLTRDIKGAKRTLSRTNLPPKYSVIGYFAGGVDSEGYGVYRNSGSHMAIYLGTYEEGILVLDQNHNGEGSLAVRKIRWESPKRKPSVLGGKYYRVVLK